MAYTYQDFTNAAEKAGLLSSFSEYDLMMAQKYPEFGLSILSAKQDYMNAKTPEQRMLANEAANELRKRYGNYTGGIDGTKFVSMGTGARQDTSIYQGAHTEAGKAPTSAVDKVDPFVFQEAPTYRNPYAEEQKAILDDIMSTGEFSWDKESDPMWSSTKKAYLREGERATENALAKMSASSGGRSSSAAVTAAAQAGDYYATQMNDQIRYLYDRAYEKYLNEYTMKQDKLAVLSSQEQQEYGKHVDKLNQFNTDRNFQYGVHRDNVKDQQLAEEREYERYILQQEIAREEALQKQTLAQEQVNAILSAGGIPSAELLAAAGYSGEYSGAINSAYQQGIAEEQKAFAQQQVNAILSAGGTPSAELLAAAGYSEEYSGAINNAYQQTLLEEQRALAQEQVNAILSAGGVPSAELLAAAGYSTEYSGALSGAYQQGLLEDQQALAQQQVNAILSAGGIPSAELLAASGYSNEYAQALGAAYQRENAEGTEKQAYSMTYSSWWNDGVRSEGEAYDRAIQEGYSNTEAENMAAYFKSWMMNRNDLLENTTGVSNFETVRDSLRSMQGIIPADSAMGMVDKAYTDGLISDEQYNELVDYIESHRWL